MLRIIEGQAYEGKSAPYVSLKAHDLGNGHIEFSAVRGIEWREIDMSPIAIEQYLEAVERSKVLDAEERQEKCLKIAANRAKKRVRRLCKVMGADTLLTLTYRANVTDLALCKRHLKEFVRRLRRVVPDFRAVCCFEHQERGALHVHMATIKFPKLIAAANGVKVKSYNVIRAVWRSVTGEHGGTVNVSNKKKGATRSPAKIAAYIAKYISKAFTEGEAGSNRWTKFGDVELPRPVDMGHYPSMFEALQDCYRLLGPEHAVVDQHLSRWDDWYFLWVEPSGGKVH